MLLRYKSHEAILGTIVVVSYIKNYSGKLYSLSEVLIML